MISLLMIYENDNYELLSIKTITDLNGNYLRYDVYMRIKDTNKIIYSQVDPSLFEYVSKGYTKKIELSTDSETKIFTQPQDWHKLNMWLRNNPNYKSKRLEYTQNEKLKPNSLEHFISFTDFIYKNNYILVEKPSEFEGEENYINESRSL